MFYKAKKARKRPKRSRVGFVRFKRKRKMAAHQWHLKCADNHMYQSSDGHLDLKVKVSVLQFDFLSVFVFAFFWEGFTHNLMSSAQ